MCYTIGVSIEDIEAETQEEAIEEGVLNYKSEIV